jgi:hypothetical protein
VSSQPTPRSSARRRAAVENPNGPDKHFFWWPQWYSALEHSANAAANASSARPVAASGSPPVEDLPQGVIVSPDQFFMGADGRYRFDARLTSQAEASCLSKFLDALTAALPIIVIDSPHASRWEYINFIKLAHAFQYDACVLELACPSLEMAHFMAARSTKNGTDVAIFSQIMDMLQRWEVDPHAILLAPFVPPIHPLPPHALQLAYNARTFMQQQQQQGKANTFNMLPSNYILPTVAAPPSSRLTNGVPPAASALSAQRPQPDRLAKCESEPATSRRRRKKPDRASPPNGNVHDRLSSASTTTSESTPTSNSQSPHAQSPTPTPSSDGIQTLFG